MNEKMFRKKKKDVIINRRHEVYTYNEGKKM